MIIDGFINQDGYQGLRQYGYKPGKWTWLDGKMNYFWQWCITLMPQWVAPNLITFIGWIFVILSYACMMVYDYTFKQIIPSWCFYFASFCIFVYSTLDAIDGKQARRTKSGSPLGQLFDHGCDSFSMTFFILAVCQALRPTSEEVFLIYVACQASFYTSNWMEYKTGVLQTAVGQFGVTEAQFTCALIHLATAIFGQQLWDFQIYGFRLGTIYAYFYSTMIGLLCIYSLISTIWRNNGSRRQCLGQLFGLLSIVIMELLWIKTQIYHKYNGIILVNFGILTSLLVCKIIICSVTKMKYKYFHNELIIFFISTMVILIMDLQKNIDQMILVFWICFAINIISIIRFIYSVIQQITVFLGIYCFSLKKRIQPFNSIQTKKSIQTKND